jgi:hypothetical protein
MPPWNNSAGGCRPQLSQPCSDPHPTIPALAGCIRCLTCVTLSHSGASGVAPCPADGCSHHPNCGLQRIQAHTTQEVTQQGVDQLWTYHNAHLHRAP